MCSKYATGFDFYLGLPHTYIPKNIISIRTTIEHEPGYFGPQEIGLLLSRYNTYNIKLHM